MEIENLLPPTSEEMRRASGMSKIAARDWPAYSAACRRRFEVIKNVLKTEYGAELSGKKILDWGCAAGGVALLMEDQYPVDMYAADVDAHSLAWLQRTNSRISCVKLSPGKVLPFEEGAFDLIYGISVLTHIPPEMQEFYLSQLSRVCKINGVVALTVKSYATCDYNRMIGNDPKMHPHDPAELKKEGIIFRSYPDPILNRMDFALEGAYGITYHSKEYVSEVFAKYFSIERIEEKALGHQDLVILRKHASALSVDGT